MERDTDNVVRDAMAMPPARRARLAEMLISSLDPQSDEDVEAAWQAECTRRLGEARSGQVQPIPWETIRDRLRNSGRASG